MLPILLPALCGYLIATQIFPKARGKKSYLKKLIYFYLIIAFFLPIPLFIYSGFYTGISPLGPILCLLFIFVATLALLIPAYQRYSYKTDEDYQASKPYVNNSAKPITIYPHRLWGFLTARSFVIGGIVFLISFILWMSTSNKTNMFSSPYLWPIYICGTLPILFVLVLRLFPRCPYCKFGLFDYGITSNLTDIVAKQAYIRQSYKNLWNVLRLKPFIYRYCNARFTFKDR